MGVGMELEANVAIEVQVSFEELVVNELDRKEGVGSIELLGVDPKLLERLSCRLLVTLVSINEEKVGFS
jgi:hypothetical protein